MDNSDHNNWYYVRDGRRHGPVPSDELRQRLEVGDIGPQTPVWRKGMATWEPAEQHFSFASSTARDEPPPLQPPTKPPGPWALGGGRSPQQTGSSAAVGPHGLYVGAPSRTFSEAISVCFQKYFGFSGRASRSEFWYFWLFSTLSGLLANVLAPVIGGLVSLALLFPNFAVTWRRLHDTDRSGWWYGGFWLALVGLIVLGGASQSEGLLGLAGLGMLAWTILMLVFLCQRGTQGPNRYG